MSGIPSSSRRRRSVPQESTNSAKKVSSGTSYKPSQRTEVSYETTDGASAGETSIVAPLQHPDPNDGLVRRAEQGTQVMAPLQHTDPNDGSVRRADRGATSKKLGSNRSGRKNVRRSLNYSNATSRTEDSAIIISRLRREILDLKQGRRSQSTPKERPRNKVNASKRRHDSRCEDFSETSWSQTEPNPRQPLESGGHSRTRPPLHVGKGQQTKEHASKKTARPGGQHAVWRALDLVSSSPFSRQIEKAKLPERYTTLRFEIYDGRSDPMAHIGCYQQSMALSRHNDPLMCRLFSSSLGEVALKWFNQLGRRTINSWVEMAKAFVARFISNSRKTKEMDALLTMKLQSNETIKQYSNRFWETYNDIDRSQMQKAAHLRRSFSIINSVHPAPMCSVRGGVMEQVISFSDSDLKDVQLPHNDPLVVTLRIGNYDVERVLIDQREALQKMRAIPSTLHQKLRFPTKDEVMELSGDQSQEPEDGEVIMTEQPEKVFFDPSNPEQFFLVGSRLFAVDREQLLKILIRNQNVFAWSVYDAPGVSPKLAYHSLNIGSEHRPIVQKRRKLAPERATTVLEEVERLLASGAIREVQYPVWLLNTVVVKKKNGKWRVCIDFTDLNKACPKNPFPLPRIDQLVDLASGQARLSFLDAFQGYHQIPMNAADQDKTAFITPRGTYCYKMMPFGLKNAGATYQRMVTKMFGHMIGKTVEVYIDDMLVKSLREENHVADLLKVFNILRESRLRLNASKCTFGVSSDKFLGHIVSRRGIKPNLDQIAALVDSVEPRNIKQVQRLTGMVAALGRFISRGSRLTYQLLHAFQFPVRGEPLFLYLAVSDPCRAGAGVVLVSPEGLVLEQAVRLKFSASNIGLRTAERLGDCHLQVFCDSQLVANQISGEYQARDERMSAYLAAVRFLLANFESIHVAQIGREHNSHADILAKLATALESDIQRTVCIETLDRPSFQNQGISICSISNQPSWMDPILSYLMDNKLPEDRKEAKMIKHDDTELPPSSKYTRGNLRKSYMGKIAGSQGDISGILVAWGLDIVGPLPQAPGNKKFLITTTDYFTKWIEAEPLSNIRDVDTKRFFWKNVITRFGIPWAAISDNGTQFESRLFKGFCSDLGIKNFFSSPGYPQSNRQAEASNKIILNGIKRKLEEAKGKWVEELPSVLWTHRTTARKSTGETPFALAYGVKAVIPLEVDIPTTQTTDFTVETNEDNLRKDLDLLEERRDLATIRRPNEGKLDPNWEGPYKVVSLAGAGSYRLEDLEGKPIPRPWNTCPNNITTSKG
uniref:Uncharacterized protein n=1 Tax=Fagus sylvatica TaxID=28930 RepID=A0A2N9I3H5_FAGSY